MRRNSLRSLIFTNWSATWVFVGAMLLSYFLGLVDTDDVLSKASNPGLITLLLLMLVSIGLGLLKIKTIAVGNLLPALLVAPIFVGLLHQFK